MTWPAASEIVDTTDVDQESDSIPNAREDILDAFQKINRMLTGVNIASGPPLLNAGGRLPAEVFDGQTLLNTINGVGGPGSFLNADLLDGLHATQLMHLDGSLPWVFPTATRLLGQELIAQSAIAAAIYPALSLELDLISGASATAGQGLSIDMYLENSGGALAKGGRLAAVWDDPTAGTPCSRMEVSTVNGSNVWEKQLVVHKQRLELFEIVATGTPDADTVWLYAQAGGLYYRTDTGVEVGPLASATGGADHGGLVGLDDNDHGQYLLRAGGNAMTADLDVGADCVLFAARTTPANPAAGTVKLYVKGDDTFYALNSAGVELALGGAGATDHGSLGGLADDDHLQYVLMQPAATAGRPDGGNVFMNTAMEDYDFRYATTGNATTFVVDAGTDSVLIGTATTDNCRLLINSPGADAVHVVTESSYTGVYVASVDGVGIQSYVSGNGSAGVFRRLSADVVNHVVEIVGPTGLNGGSTLWVEGDGTGDILSVAKDSVSRRLSVTSEAVVVNADLDSDSDLIVRGTAPVYYLLLADVSENAIGINNYTDPLRGRLDVNGESLHGVYGSTLVDGKFGVIGAGTDYGGGVRGTSGNGVGVSGESTYAQAAYFSRDSAVGTTAVVVCEGLSTSEAYPVLSVAQYGTGHIAQFCEGAVEAFSFRPGGVFHVVPVTALPVSVGEEGDVLCESTDHHLWYCDGTNWEQLDANTISGLNDATEAHTVDCSAYAQTWRWTFGAADSQRGFCLAEQTAGSGTGNHLVDISAPASSTTIPLYVASNSLGVPAIATSGALHVDAGVFSHDDAVGTQLTLTAVLTGGAAAETLMGLSGGVFAGGSGGTHCIIGGAMSATTQMSGTVDEAYGGTCYVWNSGTGTISDAYALHCRLDTVAGATITRGYLVYLDPTAQEGDVSHLYGIYQSALNQPNVMASRSCFGAATDPADGFEVHNGTGAFTVYDAAAAPTLVGRVVNAPQPFTETTENPAIGFASAVVAYPTEASKAGFCGVRGDAATDASCTFDLQASAYPNLAGVYASVSHHGSGGAERVVGLHARAYCDEYAGTVAMIAAAECSVTVDGTATEAVGLLVQAFGGAGSVGSQWAIKQEGEESSRLGGTLLLSPESALPTPTSMLHLYRNTTTEHAWALIENDHDADAFVDFRLTGVKDWVLGIDNSDGDKLKISESSALGTADRLVLDGDMVRVNDHLAINADCNAAVGLVVGGATGTIAVTDGVTEPAPLAGYAQLYVDVSSGDLCVKFGDGHVAVIANDT